MNGQKLLAGLMAASVMLTMAAAPSFAEPGQASGKQVGHHKMMKGKHGGGHEKMFEQLGLTDAQKEQMKALREGNKEAGKALHQELRAKRKALMKYMSSPDATKEQALSLSREVDKIQGQLSEKRINSWFEMRSILTPEQREKFAQIAEQKKKQWQARKGQKRQGQKPGGPQQ